VSLPTDYLRTVIGVMVSAGLAFLILRVLWRGWQAL